MKARLFAGAPATPGRIKQGFQARLNLVKCNDCLKQISSYLDGEIDSELKRTLEEHLRGCHHCEVVFDSTRRTIASTATGNSSSFRRQPAIASIRRCVTVGKRRPGSADSRLAPTARPRLTRPEGIPVSISIDAPRVEQLGALGKHPAGGPKTG